MGEHFPQGIAALSWSSLGRQQMPQTGFYGDKLRHSLLLPSFSKGLGQGYRSMSGGHTIQPCPTEGTELPPHPEDTGAGLGFTCSHSCSTQCGGQFLSPQGCTARGLVAGSHCELEITLPSRLRHATKRLMRPSPHEPEHLESKRHLDTSESWELERSGLVLPAELSPESSPNTGTVTLDPKDL